MQPQFQGHFHPDPHVSAGAFLFWLISIVAAGFIGSLATLPFRYYMKMKAYNWGALDGD